MGRSYEIPYVGMIVKNIDADDDVPYWGTGRVTSVDGASFIVNWRGVTTFHGNYPLRFLGNGRIVPVKGSDKEALDTVTMSQKVPRVEQRIRSGNQSIGTVVDVYSDKDRFAILWDGELRSKIYHLSHWREGTFRAAVSKVQAPATDEPSGPVHYGVCGLGDPIVDWRPDRQNAEDMARLYARDEPENSPFYVVKTIACYNFPEAPEPQRTDLESPDD